MFATLKAGTINAVSDLLPVDRWATLAWSDIKLRYRRTKLGPFWMTLNMALMIISVGAVWGFIFHMPMQEYLPYFAIGMVIWNYFSTTMTESCRVFLDAQHAIKAVPNPLIIYVWRLMARQVVCLGHNLLFVALLWIVMARPLSLWALAAIPGLLILTLALLGAALTLGILCARFRDIPQIVAALLQILFLVTPIIWMPERISNSEIASLLFVANPLYSLIEIVRSPLLGHETTALQWLCGFGSSIVMLMIGLMLFGRFVKRVPYWL